METSAHKVLFIDDDNAARTLTRNIFQAKGIEILVAADGEEGLRILRLNHDDITFILSDMKMPGMDGLELRRQILADSLLKDIPFAIMSGHVTRELALQGIDLKISKFLDKSMEHELIVKAALELGQMRAVLLDEKRVLKASFIEEATSILEDLEPLLLQLEGNPGDIETINTVFRLVHTIKGASGVLGMPSITKFLHHYEDLLTKVKNGKTKATPTVINILLKSYDVMGQLMEAVKGNRIHEFNFDEALQIFDAGAEEQEHRAPEHAEPQHAAQQSEAGKKKDSINVPTGLLDEFMALSGEITVIRNMVNKLVRSIERKISGDKDVELLADLLDEMHKINGSMQTRITDLRKTPIASVVRKLPRTVRDLAQQLHKDVNLEIRGEDLRVDAAIGQVLSNSLIHMVRNCTDHGIETPETRVSQGKAPVGHITLSCREQNDTVLVTIEDDGKGIDVEKIRKKIAQSGRMAPAEVERLSKRQLFNTIFESGFSTAEKVTDVSGRGVGMDMVRASVEGLRGRIDIESEPGRGSKFTISLPTPKSVVIISSLLVSANLREFAIPQEAIVRLMKLGDDRKSRDLTMLEGGPVLRFEGKLLPLISLADAFELGEERNRCKLLMESEEDLNILIVKAEEIVYGIVVDKILDAEDIVVKPVHNCIERLQAFMGATFMGDGSIGLIVDPTGLAKRSAFNFAANQSQSVETNVTEEKKEIEVKSRELLLLGLDSPGLFGCPLERVHRFEEFAAVDVKVMGTQPAIIYREKLMALYNLQTVIGLPGSAVDADLEKIKVIVLALHDRYIGLEVRSILDVVSLTGPIDTSIRDRPALAGSIFIGDRAVAIIDIDQLLLDLGLQAAIPEPELVAEVIALPAQPEEIEEPAQVAEVSGWGLF